MLWFIPFLSCTILSFLFVFYLFPSYVSLMFLSVGRTCTVLIIHSIKKKHYFLIFLHSFKVVNCPHYDSNLGTPPSALMSVLTVNALPLEVDMMGRYNLTLRCHMSVFLKLIIDFRYSLFSAFEKDSKYILSI